MASLLVFLWPCWGASVLLWAEAHRTVLQGHVASVWEATSILPGPGTCRTPVIHQALCYLIWHCCFPRTVSSWGQGWVGNRNPSSSNVLSSSYNTRGTNSDQRQWGTAGHGWRRAWHRPTHCGPHDLVALQSYEC